MAVSEETASINGCQLHYQTLGQAHLAGWSHPAVLAMVGSATSATHAVEQIINAIDAAGTRIVMTTHDLGQARRLGDEVMFLNRGRLLEKALAERFFSEPENDLAQAFLKGELLWWQRGRDNLKRKPPKQRRQ